VKFKNEFDEQLYKNLENGTDVLICDDFATSGSTLREMRDFLMSVNPNNNITAFALINQNRNY
jgi:hypoxanthine phosphoribosyltransferase